METNNVFSYAIERITRAISLVEGHAFGSHFRFGAFGYGNQLHHSCDGGWKECDGFRLLPGLDELAADLNVAIKPVMEAYAVKLRQELANECVKLGAAALKDPTFRP